MYAALPPQRFRIMTGFPHQARLSARVILNASVTEHNDSIGPVFNTRKYIMNIEIKLQNPPLYNFDTAFVTDRFGLRARTFCLLESRWLQAYTYSVVDNYADAKLTAKLNNALAEAKVA